MWVGFVGVVSYKLVREEKISVELSSDDLYHRRKNKGQPAEFEAGLKKGNKMQFSNLPPDLLCVISRNLTVYDSTQLYMVSKKMMAIEQLEAEYESNRQSDLLYMQRVEMLDIAFSPRIDAIFKPNDLDVMFPDTVFIPLYPPKPAHERGIWESISRSIFGLGDYIDDLWSGIEPVQDKILSAINALKDFAIEVKLNFHKKNASEIAEIAEQMETELEGSDKSVCRDIKLRLLELQHLVAAFELSHTNPSETSFFHVTHEEKMTALFNANPDPKSIRHFLAFYHAEENAAALFTSDPEKMQQFLEYRQKQDFVLLDEFLAGSSNNPNC